MIWTLELKSVSKLQAHFASFVNIARNFNGTCDFTFAMHSYEHEDNFQPLVIGNSSIFRLKNEDEKFAVFRRGCFWLKRCTQGESPTLAEFKYVFIFIIRARRRPIIAANHTQLTIHTNSKNPEIRGSVNNFYQSIDRYALLRYLHNREEITGVTSIIAADVYASLIRH